jgi:enoyl-CoA hydratase
VGGVLSMTGDEVKTLTLNRPQHANALDAELHAALLDALDGIAADSTVGAVVLTGAGRCFSAGGDMALIRAMKHDLTVRRATLDLARNLFHHFTTLEVPVVAAVNGPAVGAGCTLALLCDVMFVAADAYLCDPHLSVGLVPGDGATVLWPLLAGLPAARAYLLSGDRVPALDAHRLGLAHQIVAGEVLLTTARAFATRLAAQPRRSLRETKRLLQLDPDQTGILLERALAAEERSFDDLPADDRPGTTAP